MQLMLVTDLEAVAGVGWIGDYAQIALCAMEPAGLDGLNAEDSGHTKKAPIHSLGSRPAP